MHRRQAVDVDTCASGCRGVRRIRGIAGDGIANDNIVVQVDARCTGRRGMVVHRDTRQSVIPQNVSDHFIAKGLIARTRREDSHTRASAGAPNPLFSEVFPVIVLLKTP